jgi:hypothetical protein
MGEHRKLAPAKPKKTRKPSKKKAKQAPDQQAIDEITAVLDTEMNRIIAIQESLAATLEAGDATPALLRESNGLSGSLVKLSAELRQRDRHLDHSVADISPDREDELVRDFLTDISPARRQSFRDFLAEDDKADALLGH